MTVDVRVKRIYEVLRDLARRAGSHPLTILYAARDQVHSNAVVVAELLRASASPDGCSG